MKKLRLCFVCRIGDNSSQILYEYPASRVLWSIVLVVTALLSCPSAQPWEAVLSSLPQPLTFVFAPELPVARANESPGVLEIPLPSSQAAGLASQPLFRVYPDSHGGSLLHHHTWTRPASLGGEQASQAGACRAQTVCPAKLSSKDPASLILISPSPISPVFFPPLPRLPRHTSLPSLWPFPGVFASLRPAHIHLL